MREEGGRVRGGREGGREGERGGGWRELGRDEGVRARERGRKIKMLDLKIVS